MIVWQMTKSFLGIGLEVTFSVDEDGHRYATSPRDRIHLRWRRPSDDESSGEAAGIVIIGSAEGKIRRTVLHPAPKASALWGTVGLHDSLALSRDDSPIGTAKVVWLHNLDRGLRPEELRALVTWSNSGGTPPFPSD